MRKGRQGIVFITGLFLCMVIFAMVTASLGSTRRSMRITRFSHFHAQARFASRTAVARCLKRLNQEPAWEADHQGRSKAHRQSTAAGVNWEAWLENEGANSLRLQVVARQAETEERCTVWLARLARTRGHWLALTASGQVFQHTTGWNRLPDPPVPLAHPLGDRYGNLYGAARAQAGQLVTYQAAAMEWSRLPVWKQAMGMVSALTMAGRDGRYLCALEQDHGHQRLLVLETNRPDAEWQDLALPPGTITSLSGDENGRIYALTASLQGQVAVHQMDAGPLLNARRPWESRPAPGTGLLSLTRPGDLTLWPTGWGQTPLRFDGFQWENLNQATWTGRLSQAVADSQGNYLSLTDRQLRRYDRQQRAWVNLDGPPEESVVEVAGGGITLGGAFLYYRQGER